MGIASPALDDNLLLPCRDRSERLQFTTEAIVSWRLHLSIYAPFMMICLRSQRGEPWSMLHRLTCAKSNTPTAGIDGMPGVSLKAFSDISTERNFIDAVNIEVY